MNKRRKTMSEFQERQQAIQNGSHALVIGSGIAGLLAARVLLDHFEHVTVVERDSLPEKPQARPGVPQAVQSHAILVRGQRILEQLFPGLNAQLQTAGAVSVDWSADVIYHSSIGIAPRYPSDLSTSLCSRALLEWVIRRRLIDDDRAASPRNRLKFLAATQVKQLLIDESQSRVTGVQLRQGHASGEWGNSQLEELTADLIVDASGRNSALPKWLEKLGYPTPDETVIDAALGYTTRWYERPADLQVDWKVLLVLPEPPHDLHSGVLSLVEGNRWLLSLYSFDQDYPPTDDAGFLEFARSLRNPILYEAVKDAQPLSPVYSYRRTENRLRHYDRLARFPGRIVTMGDAVFGFNPYHGQGMTTAALSALVLDRCLHQQWKRSQPASSKFGQHFQKQLARSLQSLWLSTTRRDSVWLASENSPARKPNQINQLLQQYLKQMSLLSMQHPQVHRTMLEMYHLVKPSIAVFQPNIVTGVLRQAWKHMTK
jgi:2-polyprenyl-6-methoxyphenol hydroxylase-like FAD-dependent oxidoreductase